MEVFQLLDNHPWLGHYRVKMALDSLGYCYGHTTVWQMVAFHTHAHPPARYKRPPNPDERPRLATTPHQVWFVGVRYLVKIGGHWLYSILCVTAIAEPSWAPAVSTAKNLSRVVQVCRPALVQWGAPEAVVSDRTGVFLALNPCRQQLGIRWSPMPRGTPGKISPKGALPSGAECSMPMWLAAPTAGLSAAGDVRPGRSVLAPWGA
jgi:transposase InsO family protein